MFDGSFVKEIVGLAETKVINTEIGEYSTKPLYEIREDLPTPISVSSLNGLVTLIENEIGRYTMPLFVRISSPDTVEVLSAIRDDARRETPFIARAELPGFRFGEWYDVENMIIRLKTAFLPTEDRDYIIKLIGNISDQKSVQTKDDGVSQSVSVHAGISMMGETKVKPIVSLKPYRTFLEVDQPESDFLIRIREGEVALFEADGGAWKLDAKENIASFLGGIVDDTDNVVIIE